MVIIKITIFNTTCLPHNSTAIGCLVITKITIFNTNIFFNDINRTTIFSGVIDKITICYRPHRVHIEIDCTTTIGSMIINKITIYHVTIAIEENCTTITVTSICFVISKITICHSTLIIEVNCTTITNGSVAYKITICHSTITIEVNCTSRVCMVITKITIFDIA